MPGKIFISYRRDDAAADAARLADGLAARFGRASVFMDVDHLLPGERFDQKLSEALSECDVLIAVIGRRWMELLKEKAAAGERDYVRREIGEALRRGIVVIPVRVGLENQMRPLPREEELPEDIRDLALHQKHDVAHERFGRDLAELIEAIVAVRRRRQPAPARGTFWRWAGGGALGLAAVIFAAWYFAGGSGQQVPEVKKTEPSKVAIKPPDVVIKPPTANPQPPTPPVQQPAQVLSPNRAVGPLTAAEEQAIKPGHSFKECAVCPEMVVVPSGSFTMGSPLGEEGRDAREGPQRRVTNARPFAVGKFEVTFAEWDACLAEGGCRHRPDDLGWGRNRQPVINVSWNDITQWYLPWLSRKTGKTYRLLTEAEWEYVARADTTTPFWWGSSISTSQANYYGGYTYGSGLKGEYRQKALPVDSFAPNPWGLYNVHGNVWEWVQDCWNASYDGAPSDGTAWVTGDCGNRVLRGGSGEEDPRNLRSAYRLRNPTRLRDDFFGFRVGRML